MSHTLLNAVQLLAPLAGKGLHDPALGCIRVGDGAAHAGNGELYAMVDCDTTRKVPLLVPAAALSRSLSTLGAWGATVKWTTNKGALTLSAGKARGRIALLPSTDHPACFVTERARSAERNDVDGDAFLRVLRSVLPYANRNDLRKVGDGILFRGGYTIASDGIMLARAAFDAGSTPEHVLSVSGVRAVLALSKKLDEAPSAIGVHDGLHHVHWSSGVVLAGPTIDARWPDLCPMVDKAHAGAVFVEDEQLDAIRSAVSTALALAPGADAVVTLDEHGVSAGEEVQRGSVATAPLPTGRYRASALERVLTDAGRVSFAAWPEPVAFTADGFDGVLMGMRET